MTRMAIEAVGVSKRFTVHSARRETFKELVTRGRSPEHRKYFWALKDASFSVPVGSSLGLIGHNGSGKSTALKVLTGIYRPTSGHVQVNGSVSALLEVGAGFHPELTGRENIRLNATILGFSTRQINMMMDQIIEFADIGEHIDAPIKHYSSGMYVRLGFAVAVMVRPEILIVDEVIAVGDEEFQRKCYDHLHRLRRDGTTMVIVSHGLTHITDLCDEALWLDHGDVRQIGRSRDVVRAYLDEVNRREAQRAVVAAGTGSPVGAEAAPGPSHMAPGQPGELAARARRGTGELRITSVELLDHSGMPSGLAVSGQPATIRLHYSATRECRDVSLSIDVEDDSQVPVTRLESDTQADWTLGPGVGHVDFRADPILLCGGGYTLRIEALVEGRVADALDDGVSITVRSAEEAVEHVYRQPGVWSLTPVAD